ncbi:Zyg-11 member B, cell cycle regulator [Sparganum proliferum]
MLEVDCKTEMCQEICPNDGRFNVGLHKDPLETSPKTDVKCERPLAISVDGGAIGSLQRKLRRLEMVTPWRRDDTDLGTSIDKETEATRLVTDIKEATGSWLVSGSYRRYWLARSFPCGEACIVEADEVMVSFDVVSLFTSIPPDLAIDTLDGLLREKYDETDQKLKRVHIKRNHNFAFEKARVVGRDNDKMARLMLENWSSSGTLNRAIDLHPAYQALRAKLESVRAGPMARIKRVTRGRPPTLAERGDGADRKSRDRSGTLSHGRTREAGNTTPEEQRSISPPSDEGEANEHADAAATTLGVRETKGTPVRQWLRSETPQSANKNQADQPVVPSLEDTCVRWIAKNLSLVTSRQSYGTDVKNFIQNHPHLEFAGLAAWPQRHRHELEGIYQLSLKYPHITMLADRGQKPLLAILLRNKDRRQYLQTAFHNIFEETSSREWLDPELLAAVLRVMRLHMSHSDMILAGTAVVYNLTRGEQSAQLPLDLLNRAVNITLTAIEQHQKLLQLLKNCFLTLCSDTVLHRAQFSCKRCCELVFQSLIKYDDVHMKRMGVAIISILAAEVRPLS